MSLTLQQLAHATEHLQRDGEAWQHARSVVPNFSGPDYDAQRTAAYEAFLERRFEVFVDLPSRFDGIAAGWHRAAVRLFGERAEAALDALVAMHGPRAAWEGADAAELVLAYAVAQSDMGRRA